MLQQKGFGDDCPGTARSHSSAIRTNQSRRRLCGVMIGIKAELPYFYENMRKRKPPRFARLMTTKTAAIDRFGELLDDLAVERRDVVRLPAW
jgi:hypothetical protein